MVARFVHDDVTDLSWSLHAAEQHQNNEQVGKVAKIGTAQETKTGSKRVSYF